MLKSEPKGHDSLSLGLLALMFSDTYFRNPTTILGGGWGHVWVFQLRAQMGPRLTACMDPWTYEGTAFGWSCSKFSAPDLTGETEAALMLLVQILIHRNGEVIKDSCCFKPLTVG